MDGKDLENAAKLRTTLKRLEPVVTQLESGVGYSSTVDDSATRVEMAQLNQKGGTNQYTKWLKK